MAPAINNRAFEMKPGEVSEAIRSQNGFVFVTVTGTQESRVPALEEVKARVREDVQKTKAVEAARQKATAIAAQLKTAGDFTPRPRPLDSRPRQPTSSSVAPRFPTSA